MEGLNLDLFGQIKAFLRLDYFSSFGLIHKIGPNSENNSQIKNQSKCSKFSPNSDNQSDSENQTK